MSVIVTKKTHFQDSQDLDEFNIIAADWLSLQYKKKKKKKKKSGPYSFGKM